VKVAWTTDLHLNFVSDADVDQFIERARDVSPDAVLVGKTVAYWASETMCSTVEWT